MQRFLLCVVALVLIAPLVLRTQPRVDDARLPDPVYSDAVALWNAGKPADALAALDRRAPSTDGDTPIEALLLRAQLLSAAGEFQRSAALWEAATDRATLLGSLALRGAVDSHVRGGNPERAESLLAGRSTREFGDLLSAVATAYRVRGQLDRAAALYRRVVAEPSSGAVGDEAALGLAATMELAGDRTAALAGLRNLQLRFRQPTTFARARSLAMRLAERLDRPLEPLREDEYRQLTGRLRDSSMFDDAVTVLEDWKRAYPASASRIDALIVDTLYRARSNEQARARARAFLERYPDSPHVPDIRILEYRLDVREGRTEAVRSRGRALWTGTVPGIPLTERLSLGRLLAAYLVSTGALAEGLDTYDELIRSSNSRDLRIDLLWRSAVAAIRAEQLGRAESSFRTLRALSPGPETSLLADYWTAGLAERRSRRAEAIQQFTALARRAPYDYYGIRARERLAALKASTPSIQERIAFPSLLLRETSRTHSDFRAATLLARAGLKAEAAQVVRRLAAELRDDPALALLAARALAAAGDYRRAVGLVETRFGAFLDQPASGVPSDFWTLAYPRAFWEDVRPAAEMTGVDPLLLLSLARQESRFDPSVRSVVGAIGLFQIMPYTADAVAPRLGINVTDRAVLLLPRTSATFAARLVADHLAQLDADATAVMAAYNAGEDRAADWWKAARGLPDDVFVDTIPYTETRTYVRIVYTNYVRYQQLYGRGEQPELKTEK